MSYQVFLQGRLVGTEQFLTADPEKLIPRMQWASLLSEVLPRATLLELGLSPVLLGSSGADQFLLVLPGELLNRAIAILQAAAAHVVELTQSATRLIWAATESLGSWSDIRKRLEKEIRLREATPTRRGVNISLDQSCTLDGVDFTSVSTVGWSPDEPGLIQASNGKHQWPTGFNLEQVPFVQHRPDDVVATPVDLADRANGRKLWGVLVADVDETMARLELAPNIEDYLQLSDMYKRFFGSEVQRLCSQPDLQQKVTILRTGGDNFALYGSWDALIEIAREMQRLFSLFVEANLSQFAGLEGKTISMALALAGLEQSSVGGVYQRATEQLAAAKVVGKDSISVFGRIIDWKQLAEAATNRESMVRLIQHGASPQFLSEISSFYRGPGEETMLTDRHRADRLDRPWRFYRRLNSYLGHLKGKEVQRLRAELVDSFTGRRAKQVRLRPQERVALEWANLEVGQA